MTEQIDPAAVMAEHAPNVNLWRDHQWCLKCGWASSGDFTPWPCEPYRLAEALAAETSRTAKLDSILMQYEEGRISKVACVSLMLNVV